MNTCQVCTQSFRSGQKGCCSTDCYLQELQTKLNDVFMRTSHTKFLTSY